MDKLTSMQQDPNKRKKALQSTACSDVIQLALHISMVVVGVQYKDECSFGVPQYLMLGGGICLAFTVLKIIAILTPSDCDDKFVMCISPIAAIVLLCVTLWGSIIVFGHAGVVTYEKQEINVQTPRPNYEGDNVRFPDLKENIEDNMNENKYYCAYTPFMFAYVLLILNWIVLPIALCCTCMIMSSVLCALCCVGSSESSATYSAAATSDPSVTVSTA